MQIAALQITVKARKVKFLIFIIRRSDESAINRDFLTLIDGLYGDF